MASEGARLALACDVDLGHRIPSCFDQVGERHHEPHVGSTLACHLAAASLPYLRETPPDRIGASAARAEHLLCVVTPPTVIRLFEVPSAGQLLVDRELEEPEALKV